MEAYDVTSADRTPKNFAWLILYLFQQYSGAEVTEFVFSRPQDVVAWLRHQFQWKNLFDDEDKPKYNALELLEEICTFWGWQCHIQDTTVYFLQGDDPTAGELGMLDMQDMTEVADGADMTLTPVSWQTLDISTSAIISANNTLEYIPGVKNVKIRANINKGSQVVDVPIGDFTEEYRAHEIRQTGVDGAWRFILFDSIWENRFNPSANNFTKDLDDVRIRFQYTDLDSSQLYGAIMVDELYDGNIADKHNYNFTSKIMLSNQVRTPYLSNYLVRITSKQSYTLTEGAIVINMTRAQCYQGETLYDDNLRIALKFGDKFWNHDQQQWVTIENTDPVPYFGIEFRPYKVRDYRILNGPYMPYTGMGLPVDSPMGGVIELYFYGADFTVLWAITRIDVSFVRKKVDLLPNEDSENTYEVKGNAAFQSDVNIDTIFATDNNNAYGTGIILTPDGYYASWVEYSSQGGSEPKHPEQHLVDRIADYGSKARSVLSFSVQNTEITPLSPAVKITDERQTTYIPVAISHEWADDITNYTLMEI